MKLNNGNVLNEYQVSIYFNLMKIWVANPSQRFNQLVCNLVADYSNKNNQILRTESGQPDPFYLEDKQFAEFLQDLVDEYS